MAQILGVDVESDCVRAVLIKSGLRKTEVVRYLQTPIASAAAAAADVATAQPAESLEEELTEADLDAELEAEGAGPRESTPRLSDPLIAALNVLQSDLEGVDSIIVSMDGRDVSQHIVDLPAGAAKRILDVLPFQLEDISPFPMAESVIGYQTIRRTETELVLLTATAPAERVAAFLERFAAANVSPRQVAVGAAALDGLCNAIPELVHTAPLLFLELRSESTNLCVVREGVTHFSRTLSGGMDLLRTQSQSALLSEIKRSMAVYDAQGGEEIERVYLVGEGSLFSESLQPWLSEELGIECAQPLMPEAPGADGASRGAFAQALALASRPLAAGARLDMRQGRFAHARAMSVVEPKTRNRLIAMGAAVFLCFLFSTWARYATAREENDALREHLANTTREVFETETRSPAEARTMLNGGREIADPLPTFSAFDALSEISQAIPQEVTHDTRRLEIEVDDTTREGRFEIQGVVLSLSERDIIAANLRNIRCFREVEAGPTSAAADDAMNYRIEGEIYCPGDVAPVSNERSSRRSSNRD